MQWSRGVGLLVALGGSARAGQLHVQSYGLKEVAAAAPVTVLVGKVLSVSHASGVTLELEVTDVFAKGTPAAARGAHVQRKVYGGVVWTDPHKSPMDARLRGNLAPDRVAVGDVVVAVPARLGGGEAVELLPASAPVLRKLAIFFDPTVKYASEPDARLAADLPDPDLVELAAAELRRRGRLDAAALLTAESQFLDGYVRALPVALEKQLIADALPLTRANRALRLHFVAAVLRAPNPAILGALPPLVAQLDFADADEHRHLDDFRLELVILADGAKEHPVDFTPLGDFLLAWELRRPDYRDSDDDLAKLTAHLDSAARTRLAIGFFDGLYTSARARGEFDGFLLGEASRLGEATGSPLLLPALAKLDPSRSKVLSDQRVLMDVLLAVGTAVARKSPASRQRIRDLAEPWIDQDLPASDDVLAAYRKVVGATPKGSPKAARFELRPGEMRRLSTATRVTIHHTGSDYELRVGNDGWTLPGDDDDWYREWWAPPFVVILNRLGPDGHVSVQFVPHAAEPPTLSGSDGYEQAKKLSAHRGCPSYESHEYDEFGGRFVYKASGPDGRACTILIGGRTRKLIRVTP